jgi:hypothetical protein
MPWSRYVLGYHGCDLALAREVVLGEKLLVPSVNNYDWLGHGIYFWEDSPGRAMRWAQEESKKAGSRIKTPCVLGAVIDLGNCLNLIDAEFLDVVRSTHERFEKTVVESGVEMPKNSGLDLRNRKLDCAVFQSLHEFREEDALPAFDTVRAFFVEGEPLYATAGIRALDHIQICVRKMQKVVGYFLAKDV